MSRNLVWAAVLGTWLLGLLGSAFVLFVEVTDGSEPGIAFPISLGVLALCLVAAMAYPFVVPKPSRAPPTAWISAAVVFMALLALLGFLTLMVALGAIRG